jgi:cyclopropane-fatty-acyl-phospholipid synthase
VSLRVRISRAVVSWMLRRIRDASLTVEEGGARRTHGTGALQATLVVRSPRMWPTLLRGSRGLADAYAAGWWDSPDLVKLIRVAARNAHRLDRIRRFLEPASRPLRAALAPIRTNTRRRSRQHIAAHYDLGNELFSRMLDPTMTYSCAIFERPWMSLEDAQLAKLEAICRKLDLGPGDHLLEIGTGWGSLALHAAVTRGCRVTTTTISAEQHAYASSLIRQAGVEDRVTVLLRDYRDLTGRYDKLVSVEMIEAVGWRKTGDFFAACSGLLRPHGKMLLQAITIDDLAYDVEKDARSFMNTRIFPGGSLPSLEVIGRCVAQHTDLLTASVEDFTSDYVLTLKEWRERFVRHARELEELGYDERFRRLWTLYLAYCEAGFAERRIQSVQVVLAKAGALASSPAAALAGRRRARDLSLAQ